MEEQEQNEPSNSFCDAKNRRKFVITALINLSFIFLVSSPHQYNSRKNRQNTW